MSSLTERFEAAGKPVKIGLACLAFAVLYVMAGFIPPGFDWIIFFGRRTAPPFYVPWVHWILPVLTWPLVVVLTLIALGWATWRRKGSPLTLSLVLSSLPVMWTLYLGQLDGLALLGLCLAPVGAPLALLKPQLTAFAMLADRRRFAAAAIWGVVSLAIWGLWPLTLMGRMSGDWKIAQPQDISLFPWSIPFVLPLLWLSRGDEDMLMAAGSLMAPLLIPYYFLVLMPALARLPRRLQVLCWVLSWMPLSANWLGPIGWHFGNLFSMVLWLGLWRHRTRKRPAAPQLNPNPDRQPGQ
jgi:hypothetical protein